MTRLLFTVLLAALFVRSLAGAQTSSVVPDVVLKNGHIYTGDKRNPWVEAVSMRGERIVLAGSDAVVTASAGAQTQVIDLHGRMAMP